MLDKLLSLLIVGRKYFRDHGKVYRRFQVARVIANVCAQPCCLLFSKITTDPLRALRDGYYLPLGSQARNSVNQGTVHYYVQIQ